MGKILGMLAAGVVYFCVATVIAETLMLGYLFGSGALAGDRWDQIVALAQGADIASLIPQQPVEETVDNQEKSLDELSRERAATIRDLELREQALRRGLDALEAGRLRLLTERRDYRTEREMFEKTLAESKQGETVEGQENVRNIISGMKPKQAKEQLLEMLGKGEMNEVVQLLGEMPSSKRNKIIAEFKAPDEVDKMGEILRLMRAGGAEAQMIGDTQEQLSGPRSASR